MWQLCFCKLLNVIVGLSLIQYLRNIFMLIHLILPYTMRVCIFYQYDKGMIKIFTPWKNDAIPLSRSPVLSVFVKSVHVFFTARIQSCAKLVGTPVSLRSHWVSIYLFHAKKNTSPFVCLFFKVWETLPPPQINVEVNKWHVFVSNLFFTNNIEKGERGGCSM